MPPRLATVLCLGSIVWLFYRDHQRPEKVSPALWIPLLWLFIIGSRPISVWFGFGGTIDALEGSPFDRLFFFVLIIASVVVLLRRRLDWGNVARNNGWLLFFFLYLGLSVVWSDYPFVALKRWIKDVGNIFMVLIVLSEERPVHAAKVLLTRCCYLFIPLSVLLVKYYPDLGRYYDRWNGRAFYCGVTTDKNMLGMALFACGLVLVWILFELRGKRGRGARSDYFIFLSLGALLVWLLHLADSSTAIACTTLGALIFWAMRFRVVQQKIRRVGTWTVATALLLLFLHVTLNLGETMVTLLGRDMTFTGRTEIWSRVLQEDINPILGEGFYSFWLGDRADRISAGYGGEINEAHNAFLETYLNSGWIGLFLLTGLLVSTMSRAKRQAMAGESFGSFRMTCTLIVIPYSMTEAIFNRLSPIWFLVLLLIVEYRRPFRLLGQPKLADENDGAGYAERALPLWRTSCY